MKRKRDGRATITVSPTTAGIIAGDVDLGEWDDEELLRGQRKNRRGGWTGRPPVVVAAALHRELTKRRFQRATALLADSLVDAALLLRAIVNDERAPKADRIRAAEIILDRVLGKAKESIAIDIEAKPFERIVASAIVPTLEHARALATGEVVEGEVVEG